MSEIFIITKVNIVMDVFNIYFLKLNLVTIYQCSYRLSSLLSAEINCVESIVLSLGYNITTVVCDIHIDSTKSNVCFVCYDVNTL